MQRVKACANAVVAILMVCAGAEFSRAAEAPDPSDSSVVERGAYLARAGDCEACHTTPGGAPYAGGAALNSPYGPLYAPNITPDKVHGIGAWSDDEFYRALHEGVGRHGENLYPAFPYQWFTKVTRDDVLAIRAFLNTVPPSSVPSKPNRLMFPFNIRAGLGPWNCLYFHPGVFQPDATKPDAWNRGAYLVEGLGHCGDCHTPKGIAMQPLRSKAFSGGEIDDWYAPNITSDPARGIGSWSEDALVQYLKTGSAPGKGVAVGPMSQVAHDSLAHLTDSDLHAIAAYLKSAPPIADYQAERPTGETGPRPAGEDVYLDHCASCHQINGQGLAGAVPALAGNGVVQAKGPEDVIRVILGGRLATGTFAPMPAVGAEMTDQEIADVTDYVRNAWSNAAPPVEKTGLVGQIRARTTSSLAGSGAREDNNDPCRIGEYSPAVPSIDDSEINQTLAGMTAESMLPAIPTLIARVREISPGRPQADIVNGLMLAYCRIESRMAAFRKPNGRELLDRFGQLVYSELVSNGRE